MADVTRARGEAVNRNICITMCMSSSAGGTSPACTTSGTDWQVGWIVFLNPGCSSTLNTPISTADVIVARPAISADYLLQAQGSSPTKKFVFNASGAPGVSSVQEFDAVYRAVNDPLTLKYAINICVDAMGRPRPIPNDKDCSSYR